MCRHREHFSLQVQPITATRPNHGPNLGTVQHILSPAGLLRLSLASLLLLLGALAGCAGRSSSTGGSSSGGPTPVLALRSIAVTGAATSLLPGATQPLTATATYSDNSTKDITATSTWTSSLSTVATVSANGTVTAVAAGNAVLTATQSGISGTFALTVTAPSLLSLEVTPAGSTVYTGRTQQYAATGRYSDNSTKDLTAAVTWSAAATAITAGLVTGAGIGSTTI